MKKHKIEGDWWRAKAKSEKLHEDWTLRKRQRNAALILARQSNQWIDEICFILKLNEDLYVVDKIPNRCDSAEMSAFLLESIFFKVRPAAQSRKLPFPICPSKTISFSVINKDYRRVKKMINNLLANTMNFLKRKKIQWLMWCIDTVRCFLLLLVDRRFFVTGCTQCRPLSIEMPRSRWSSFVDAGSLFVETFFLIITRYLNLKNVSTDNTLGFRLRR